MTEPTDAVRLRIGQHYVRGFAPDAENRIDHDFYPTPGGQTTTLLSVETFEGLIWEPACGDGAISKLLQGAGYSTIDTDLVDHGFGTPGVNFLTDTRTVDNIVTNPPFKLMEEFIEHAVAHARKKVAILGRLQLLEGQKRRRMWDAIPPARVWVFSKRFAAVRPDETPYGTKGGKGGMIAFAWYVWDAQHAGKPELGWIP